jgi:hypothetical protein
MSILITIIILAIVSTIVSIKLGRMSYDYKGTSLLCGIIATICWVGFFFMLIGLSLNHGFAKDTIIKYNSLKQTIATQRELGYDLENATITKDIIEMNKNIESDRYWNNTVWDIFIPDVLIEERELLK